MASPMLKRAKGPMTPWIGLRTDLVQEVIYFAKVSCAFSKCFSSCQESLKEPFQTAGNLRLASLSWEVIDLSGSIKWLEIALNSNSSTLLTSIHYGFNRTIWWLHWTWVWWNPILDFFILFSPHGWYFTSKVVPGSVPSFFSLLKLWEWAFFLV